MLSEEEEQIENKKTKKASCVNKGRDLGLIAVPTQLCHAYVY